MLFSFFLRIGRYGSSKRLGRIPGTLPIFGFLFQLFSPRVINVHGSKMRMDSCEAVLLC
jgi:hypothetical protein